MIDDSTNLIEIETSWSSLERAFENNAPEIHSYLNLRTGDVIRLEDGRVEPDAHERIASDTAVYLELEAIGSRTQYGWMKDFASEVDDEDAREDLLMALEGGRGAFKRFKEALARLPPEGHWERKHREYRSGRLRQAIEEWLADRGLVATDRARPKVVLPPPRAPQPQEREKLAGRVSDITASLSMPKLETVRAFAEFVSNQN